MPLFYPSFGLGCLLMLLLTGYAQIRWRSASERTRWLRYALHRIARVWLGWGVSLGLLQHDVHRQRFDAQAQQSRQAPCIVLANHPSLVDVIFILAELPQLCCVLKAELGHIPVLSMLIRKLRYLSNDDPESLLQEGEARLKQGESLLIFAEGTRTKSRTGMQFRLGAAELALRAQVPVRPVIIHYQGRYLSGVGRWYEFPEQRLHYAIEIGDLLMQPAASDANARRGLRRRFNSRLERYFEQRLHQGPPQSAVVDAQSDSAKQSL